MGFSALYLWEPKCAETLNYPLCGFACALIVVHDSVFMINGYFPFAFFIFSDIVHTLYESTHYLKKKKHYKFLFSLSLYGRLIGLASVAVMFVCYIDHFRNLWLVSIFEA